jgi:uncharacterized protein involved in exopolysaccharide biosynthesis
MNMNRQLDFERFEPPIDQAHYEAVAARVLRSIMRHCALIASVVAVALGLATFAVSQLPRKYTAEALVKPELFRRVEGSAETPLAIVELVLLVNSEALLIRSPATVRAVVERLGLDSDPEFAGPNSALVQGIGWVRAALLPETTAAMPGLDRAVGRVRGKLAVANSTQTYVISISFTASSPGKAAKVANAFALEYARIKKLRRASDAIAAASRELTRQLMIYGELHPSVEQFKRKLEAERALWQAEADQPEMTAREVSPSDGIALAEPNLTPSSPKGAVILGVAFVVAVVCGVGLALWRDRRLTRNDHPRCAP